MFILTYTSRDYGVLTHESLQQIIILYDLQRLSFDDSRTPFKGNRGEKEITVVTVDCFIIHCTLLSIFKNEFFYYWSR